MVSGGRDLPVGTELPATNPSAAAAPRDALPIYVRQVVEEARLAELAAVSRKGRPAAGSVVVISVVRNERPVIGDFLAHYRGLGADRFVMLDNGSEDGTLELLAAEPDVDLYLVRHPFHGQAKQGWIMRAIALYGYDRWYVHADADEHLVFDGARSLRELIAFAEARGLRRLRGMLVDMYAAGQVFAAEATGSRPLSETFRLFDRASYVESLCKQRVSRRGGPRKRMIGGDAFDPELTKYPVFHIRAGEVVENPHHIYPYPDNFTSPCLVALLHYKFTDRFPVKIRDAVARGCYYNDSAEYRAYLEAMLGNPGLTLAYPGSGTYAGPADLVACGLIAPIPDGRRGPSGLLGWLGWSKPAAG
jgi:hypothetical protein